MSGEGETSGEFSDGPATASRLRGQRGQVNLGVWVLPWEVCPRLADWCLSHRGEISWSLVLLLFPRAAASCPPAAWVPCSCSERLSHRRLGAANRRPEEMHRLKPLPWMVRVAHLGKHCCLGEPLGLLASRPLVQSPAEKNLPKNPDYSRIGFCFLFAIGYSDR